jgi:glycosyltransferase involved in cell wall biosynthesis
MKLGIISTVGGYSWAGSEEMWKVLALEAVAKGHQIAVSAHAPIAASEELADLKAKGGMAFARPAFNRLTRRLAARGLYSRFGRMVSWDPDVLCLSVGMPADPVWQPDLLRYLNAFKKPLVIIVQGNAEGFVTEESQRRLLRPLFSSAAGLICVSRQNASLLERQLALGLSNVVVWPNPVRTRLSEPLAWPVNSDGVVRLATVARFETLHKCQDHTLEALASPAWRRRNWHLSLFGSGPDEGYLRGLVRHYGLEGRVSLPGYVRDFRDIWANHHLHILNSHSEGLALALIESMFCGRPAVVTRAGGNPELVRDGIDGFVSPGMHPEIIAETLERAWAGREQWRQMGAAAFERASGWVPADLAARLLETILSCSSRRKEAPFSCGVPNVDCGIAQTACAQTPPPSN